MNILYVSNLTGDLWAGPNNSVPAQIKAQAKLDNVFWYNVNKNIIKEWVGLYHNLLEYPSEKLADLPHPFNKPNLLLTKKRASLSYKLFKSINNFFIKRITLYKYIFTYYFCKLFI